MAAPNPFIRQLAASRGVVDLKVKTKDIKNLRSGLFRYDYRVTIKKKGKIVSIVDVLPK